MRYGGSITASKRRMCWLYVNDKHAVKQLKLATDDHCFLLSLVIGTCPCLHVGFVVMNCCLLCTLMRSAAATA
jgi:hypothetical protein